MFVMPSQPSFDETAPLGRFTLLLGAYAPVLAILGLRIGMNTAGVALCVAAAIAIAAWLLGILVIVDHRQAWDVTVISAEPAHDPRTR
jgi:hypothetical protein